MFYCSLSQSFLFVTHVSILVKIGHHFGLDSTHNFVNSQNAVETLDLKPWISQSYYYFELDAMSCGLASVYLCIIFNPNRKMYLQNPINSNQKHVLIICVPKKKISHNFTIDISSQQANTNKRKTPRF